MNTTTSPPRADRITLYYREGSSDKVYQCSIEPAGDLCVVNFAYGRRGATLQTGTKTAQPVDYPTAQKIYDKLVGEKTAKGYTPGADGIPYRHPAGEERATAILPQLVNPVELDQLAYLLKDDAWCMQEKKDGRRLLIQKAGAAIHGINRKGWLVGLPSPVVGQVSQISGDLILDGECVGEVIHVFDILQSGDMDVRDQPYRERWDRVSELLRSDALTHLVRVEHACAPLKKALLFKRLEHEQREGVVFKRLDAPYTPGRPNSGGSQLKHKFCASLSAVVARLNPQRSVEVRLLSGEGWVPAGNVTIPTNHPVPKVGTVVEIRYLYAMPGSGRLYQPVYLGPRLDIAQHECGVSQLKFKSAFEES